jgi:hypothetical protein
VIGGGQKALNFGQLLLYAATRRRKYWLQSPNNERCTSSASATNFLAIFVFTIHHEKSCMRPAA